MDLCGGKSLDGGLLMLATQFRTTYEMPHHLSGSEMERKPPKRQLLELSGKVNPFPMKNLNMSCAQPEFTILGVDLVPKGAIATNLVDDRNKINTIHRVQDYTAEQMRTLKTVRLQPNPRQNNKSLNRRGEFRMGERHCKADFKLNTVYSFLFSYCLVTQIVLHIIYMHQTR